jgi:hypothetical protein
LAYRRAEDQEPRHPDVVIVRTIGHVTRSIDEFTSVVREAGIVTLIDVRRFLRD